ncbi:MAG: hypothetical protein CME26_10385 [Gemmatimonadetes bacterium]|nr:hypothetical protein [Gemmatimonadota bacterium]
MPKQTPYQELHLGVDVQGVDDRMKEAPTGTRADHTSLQARCMADVAPMSVEWLWHPLVPLGHLTGLNGDPGEGKSFLTQALATAVSLGQGLPANEETNPGNVLILTAEDHLGTTVRPRLEAMGCDLTRVFAYDRPFSLEPECILDLEARIAEMRARLVILDPIVAYMASSVDINRANEVRTVLAQLSDAAERTSSAIVIVRHLAKGNGSKAIYRGLGSVDFTAACRSELLAGHAAEDVTARALVHTKSNLGPKGEAQGYSIENGVFRWTGPSTLTAEELLAQPDTSRHREAMDFLIEFLALGRQPSEEVKAAAKAEGITYATLRRAKNTLRIKSRNIGERWDWELPEEDAQV